MEIVLLIAVALAIYTQFSISKTLSKIESRLSFDNSLQDDILKRLMAMHSSLEALEVHIGDLQRRAESAFPTEDELRRRTGRSLEP